METKVVAKFAVFSIFYYGKRPKIVTKNDMSLLKRNIFSKFKLRDEFGAIPHEINVI